MRGNKYKQRFAEFASNHEWKIKRVYHKNDPAFKMMFPTKFGHCDCCNSKIEFHYVVSANGAEDRIIGSKCFSHLFGTDEGTRVTEAINSIVAAERYSYRKQEQWSQIDQWVRSIGNLPTLVQEKSEELGLGLEFAAKMKKFLGSKKRKNPSGFASRFIKVLDPNFKFIYSDEYILEEDKFIVGKINEWVSTYNFQQQFSILPSEL